MILGLTKEALIERRNGIGGSDARAIMEGRWYDLWLDKTGRVEPEDLSGNLSVLLGHATEQLNLYLFERATGLPVTRRGEVCIHPYFSFARCTLDGFIDGMPRATVQAKWTNPRMRLEELEQKTMPQCHHEMLVCGCDLAYLPILTGTPSHEIVEIQRDEEYSKILLEREEEFWYYVANDLEPPDAPVVAPPVKISKWRAVDLSDSNVWTTAAVDWLTHKESAKKFNEAAALMRELVEVDVGRAYGRGVEIIRNKAGSLMIRELKTNG